MTAARRDTQDLRNETARRSSASGESGGLTKLLSRRSLAYLGSRDSCRQIGRWQPGRHFSDGPCIWIPPARMLLHFYFTPRAASHTRPQHRTDASVHAARLAGGRSAAGEGGFAPACGQQPAPKAGEGHACPRCNSWFTTKSVLSLHLKDAHNEKYIGKRDLVATNAAAVPKKEKEVKSEAPEPTVKYEPMEIAFPNTPGIRKGTFGPGTMSAASVSLALGARAQATREQRQAVEGAPRRQRRRACRRS